MVNTRSKRNADTTDLATGDIISSPPKRKRTTKQTKQDENQDKDTETTSTSITETTHEKTSNKGRGRGRKKNVENTSVETENTADRSHAEAHAQAALLADEPPTSTSDQTSESASTSTSTLAPPSTSTYTSTSTSTSTSPRPVSTSPLPRETLNITKPSLYEFLTTNTVAQLLNEKPKKQMITIEHNATLRTCIEKMAENHVLSLPMVSGISIEDLDTEESGDGRDESGQFMGNLDVSAIVHAFIQHIDAYGSDPFHIRQFWDRLCITVHSNDADVSVLMKTEENVTLRELIHQCFFHTLSNKIPLNTSSSSKPSDNDNALPSRDDAIPLGYVHRVAVFDGRGHVRDIISQTDLIRYLASHLSSYGSPLLSQTIEELCFVDREVNFIPYTMTAMAALRTVDEQEWTGVAIVDQKKHLVGSLTTNDLRGLTMSDMDHVLEPICDWLKRIATHQHREGLPVQYVIPDHTIQQCIDGMLLDGVHRLYVVESYHNPIPTGVITLTDLLELLFTHY